MSLMAAKKPGPRTSYRDIEENGYGGTKATVIVWDGTLPANAVDHVLDAEIEYESSEGIRVYYTLKVKTGGRKRFLFVYNRLSLKLHSDDN